MNTLFVSYGSQRVGILAEVPRGLVFEYDRAFLASGHELSPLNLPLGPGLRQRAPDRLPGLFEDSLPDLWGRRVMMEGFRRQGVAEHAVTPLAMLAYVGSRGMGALTYEPEREAALDPETISLDRLQQAATQAEREGAIDLDALGAVASSAGGARPKALIGLPRGGSGPILPGEGPLPSTHEAWLVKLDTGGEGTAGALEEAYASLARAAGLDLPETRLLESKGKGGRRRHFAVRRFDREQEQRIHHHTLAGICEAEAGDLDYRDLLRVARRVTRDEGDVERAFRRAAFNVLAGNRDDHGKNHGFIYRDGQWRLGPAYDLTFVRAERLPERGMAVLGERRLAGRSHLLKLAEAEGLGKKVAAAALDRIRAAQERWREFAEAAGVPRLAAAEVEASWAREAAAAP